tara:strand:+ start:6751 stop:8943 length:2193 start_codon:yes stop_codon:yes gene_type:complete
MAEGKIRVKFDAQGDKALIDAIRRLNQATKQLGINTKKTEKSTDKAGTSTERLGRNTDKLKGGFFGLSTSLATARAKMLLYGFAVKQVIDFTKGLVDKSAQFEDISRGFNNLRMSAGMSAETFDKLNIALDGTVSSIDLMKQANNAMLLGIFKTEDEMANMFDAAQRLAQVLGKDATFGIESLVTGLGRQSKLMLDNLGIVFSAEKAYVDYSNVLKKNVGDLTDSERKQAFLNKAMQSAEELVSNAGDEYLGTSAKLAQLNTSFVNARIELGKALTPVILASVDALRFMLDNMDSGRIKRWGVAIGGAYAAFKLYNIAIRIAKIETISFQAILAKTGWGTIIAVIGLAAGALMEYFGAFDEGTEILKDGNRELAENKRILKAQQEALDEVMKTQRLSAEGLQKDLDLLNAKTETEKMLINLGHEASASEKDLINQIINKTNALQLELDLKDQLVNYEKWHLKNLDEAISLRQSNNLLIAETEGATTTELNLLKEQVDFENKLAETGAILLNGKIQDSEVGGVLSEQQKIKIALLNEEHNLNIQLIQDEKDKGQEAIKTAANTINAMSKVIGLNKKNAVVAAKMAAIATGVNAFASASAAMKSAAEVPMIGHILAPIAYASTLATGLAAATSAHLEASKIQKFEQGGLIGGRRHSQGGTNINAEQGEFVMSRNAVSAIGVENLNRMNDGSGGGGGTTININGGMISPDFVENELAEAIREATRRGADFGIS